MLFDLTRISEQRVAQVDELKVGARHYIRSSTLFIFLGGAFAGLLPAMLLQMLFGGMWPYMLVPAAAIAAAVLFDRKRSTEGEKTQRRIEKMWADRHSLDGEFILPAGEPFSPNGYELIEMHSHPKA